MSDGTTPPNDRSVYVVDDDDAIRSLLVSFLKTRASRCWKARLGQRGVGHGTARVARCGADGPAHARPERHAGAGERACAGARDSRAHHDGLQLVERGHPGDPAGRLRLHHQAVRPGRDPASRAQGAGAPRPVAARARDGAAERPRRLRGKFIGEYAADAGDLQDDRPRRRQRRDGDDLWRERHAAKRWPPTRCTRTRRAAPGRLSK